MNQGSMQKYANLLIRYAQHFFSMQGLIEGVSKLLKAINADCFNVCLSVLLSSRPI